MACIHHAVPQPAICEVCARDVARSRGKKRAALVALVGLLPLAGAVVVLQTRPKPPPPAPVEPDNVLRLQADALAKHPCDAKMLSERVERLVTLQRQPEALATAERAVGCGVSGRMPWRVAYLSQQLHQWLVTVVVTTELLTDNPDDSDFWWWRADAWMDGKLPRLALLDLRQSLANSHDAQAAGFAAVRILDAARATNELCEADRAWRYVVHALGEVPDQDMRDEHAALVRDKACDGDVGNGLLPSKVRVTIHGTTGNFIVDPRVGTTQVSRVFAAKAGIESDAKLLGIAYVGESGPQLGEPVLLDSVIAGPLRAAGVDALVTDNVSETGADGVLGLSFLWHYAFEPAAGGWMMRPLDRQPL